MIASKTGRLCNYRSNLAGSKSSTQIAYDSHLLINQRYALYYIAIFFRNYRALHFTHSSNDGVVEKFTFLMYAYKNDRKRYMHSIVGYDGVKIIVVLS